MQFATTVNGRRKATPQATGWCPGCSDELVTKCGEINIWHWAHKPDASCDWDTGKMSDWHIEWQEHFDEDKREVRVEVESKRRMADVIAQDGTVLEFQHSSININTIKDREAHYKKMLWIFDASDLPDDRFIPRGRYAEWKHPRKSWLITGVETYYDLGTGWLWLVNEIVEWDYVRVYGYSVSKDDFINWAKTGTKEWKVPTWAKYTHDGRQAYEAEKRKAKQLEKRDLVIAARTSRIKERASLAELEKAQRIGKVYPTEFGGIATIQRYDDQFIQTKTGLWWTLRSGVLKSA